MESDERKSLHLPKPIDYTKLTPYQRQQQRVALLATPKREFSATSLWSTIRKTSRGVAVAALKARCTPHTDYLSVPKLPLPKLRYITRAEKEAQRELEEEMTKEELRWLRRKPIIPLPPTGVKKSALKAKCTPRLDVIAMAKLLFLTFNKQCFYEKLSENQRNAISKRIKAHFEEFKSNHPPEVDKTYTIVNGAVLHTTCTGRGVGKPERYICELNRAQRKMFRRRMKRLGAPRPPPPPSTGPDRGPKKSIKDMQRWLDVAAQPRYNVADEVQYNPFIVKPSAKFYTPTERVLQLSKPKKIPPPPPFTDFEGNELPPRRDWSYNSRRRIVATPRTVELSAPRFVKKKAAEDVKEDPFAVVRRALTAVCTPRVAELAEPRKR